MEAKHFWGNSIAQALVAVRNALGPDALILGTRSVPTKNGEGIEITAMADHEEERLEERQRQGGEENSPLSQVSVISGVREELAELKSMFSWLVPGMGHNRVLEELAVQGLSRDIINRLVNEMDGMEGTDQSEKIRHALTLMIPVGGDLEIVRKEGATVCHALIGPTGVGKTTTLVKLTIRLMSLGKCRVGWVSVANRQIVGSEQLAVYAGVLGVPYEYVESKRDLEQVRERFSDCDLVFIDVPGVSPRDTEGFNRMAGFLRETSGIERTLLLSASTNDRDMAAGIERYKRVGFDSLLFTKIDEGNHFGPLINTAITSGYPVSYMTSGQNVVGDLEVATAESMTNLVLPCNGRKPMVQGSQSSLSGSYGARQGQRIY